MLPPRTISPTARRVASFAFLGALSSAVSASLHSAEQVPTNLLAVPEGFEVTIWAQSPMLRNPTNMDVDHAGRIWVAEGVNYRYSEGRDPKGDRIVVIEDADGDGKADKSWTFVQEPGLIAPLGVAVIDNKVYVSNAPDLIVYTDVDGDLTFDPRVDKREVLLTGFNGVNHDHSLHSVTFGPDGLLYLNHGNSGALVADRSGRMFRVGSAYDGLLKSSDDPLYGVMPIEYAGAKSDDGHVYVGGFAMRIRPDGTNLEVIGHNFRNSYEQTVTSFGDVFQNDNDDPPASRTSYLLEYGNAGWFSRDGSRYWNADRRPGQDIPTSQWRQEDPGVMPAGDIYGAGAPTGIAFYEGDAFGPEWRGMLLSCEAARNVVFGYMPKNDGSGFALERFNFLTSNQEEELAGTDALQGKTSQDLKTFFRPSDAVVGPDGAVYVADWFDARVGGHQDLDKTTSGTIYRIARKGAQHVTPRLDVATVAGQIEALKSPAVNVRALGFNRLRAAGDAVFNPVSALLKDDNPYVRGRAIWLLAQLGDRGEKAVAKRLRDPDAQTRATAFQALRQVRYSGLLDAAAALARDDSPIVRREVALALRDVSLEDSRDILLTLASGYDGSDRSYLEAWGIGCAGKEDAIYAALKQQRGAGKSAVDWDKAYAHLVWRLTPTAAVEDFAARAAASQLELTARIAAVTALGFTDSAEAAQGLLSLAQSSDKAIAEQALWWLLNYRNTRWQAFDVNAALKRSGLYDPAKLQVAGSVIPKADPAKMLSAEAVAQMQGDAARGAARVAVCYSCHKVGGQGVEYAPDLTGWTDRQSTEVTINAIVNPSLDIAHGFDGREVVLKDGTLIHGVIESYGDPLVVRSMGGAKQMVPQERIERVNWFGRSLMLSADQLGLSEQDVADIIAYLKTKR